MPQARLYVADARRLPLADGSVHVCITSPPYWQKRRGLKDSDPMKRLEIGNEPVPQEWVEHLMMVFREVWRVLRPDGLLWVNVGSTYAGNKISNTEMIKNPALAASQGGLIKRTPLGYKLGDVVDTPHMLAHALQQDGWLWRSTMIWHKLSVMPESIQSVRWEKHQVKVGNKGRGREKSKSATGRPQQDHIGRDFARDAQWAPCPGCPKCLPNDGLVLRRGSWRLTLDFEYIFQLAKGPEYYSDGYRVRETGSDNDLDRPLGRLAGTPYLVNRSGSESEGWGSLGQGQHLHNLRSVQAFPAEPLVGEYAGQHFAAFPTSLPELFIKASTSEKGVCAKCGAPWARMVEHFPGCIRGGAWAENLGHKPSERIRENGETTTLGFRPTCRCKKTEVAPALVLDPFVGSGSTGIAALRLGCDFVGVDISEKYIALAAKRIREDAPLFNVVEVILGGAQEAAASSPFLPLPDTPSVETPPAS